MENLVDIFSKEDKGYGVVHCFERWKVALLNSTPFYHPENITYFQKHDETDEIFVLLEGACTLFLAEGNEAPTTLHALHLEPGKVYNVKRGVWHTHTLGENSKVFIVENENTGDANSPKFFDLTDEMKAFILHNGDK